MRQHLHFGIIRNKENGPISGLHYRAEIVLYLVESWPIRYNRSTGDAGKALRLEKDVLPGQELAPFFIRENFS